jgi:hypothetical protein
MQDRTLYSIQKSPKLLRGLFRNTMYRLLRTGQLARVRIASREFIGRAAIAHAVARSKAIIDPSERRLPKQDPSTPRAATVHSVANRCTHADRPACTRRDLANSTHSREPSAPAIRLQSLAASGRDDGRAVGVLRPQGAEAMKGRDLHSIEEARELLGGISRSTIDAALQAEVASVVIIGRRFITAAVNEEFTRTSTGRVSPSFSAVRVRRHGSLAAIPTHARGAARAAERGHFAILPSPPSPSNQRRR